MDLESDQEEVAKEVEKVTKAVKKRSICRMLVHPLWQSISLSTYVRYEWHMYTYTACKP